MIGTQTRESTRRKPIKKIWIRTTSRLHTTAKHILIHLSDQRSTNRSHRKSAESQARLRNLKESHLVMHCWQGGIYFEISIFFRFRHYSVAVTADIEALFMQIGIQSQDLDNLHLLWSEDVTAKILNYNRLILRARGPPHAEECKWSWSGASSSSSTWMILCRLNLLKRRPTEVQR